jgi:hypothetical protein
MKIFVMVLVAAIDEYRDVQWLCSGGTVRSSSPFCCFSATTNGRFDLGFFEIFLGDKNDFS